MAKALDLDLRERIVRAVERGQSKVIVAARFEVGYSTVKKLCRQWRDTGSLKSNRHRCGRKRGQSAMQAGALPACMAADPNRALTALAANCGVTAQTTAERCVEIRSKTLDLPGRNGGQHQHDPPVRLRAAGTAGGRGESGSSRRCHTAIGRRQR